MRNPYDNSGFRFANSFKLFHNLCQVINVLKNMRRINLVKLIVPERIWEFIQIMNNINAVKFGKIKIDISFSGVASATKIKFSHKTNPYQSNINIIVMK